jgi:hypothetical protein
MGKLNIQSTEETTVNLEDHEARVNLRLDYEKTLEQFAMLADIRFKLLGFVPTLAALAVGALGFVMTIAILIYEVGNSQLYDAIIHRAKFLEGQFGLPLSTPDAKSGGAFNERSGRSLKLFGVVSIWHDRGLSLAYGAALRGWAFVMASNGLALAGSPDQVLAATVGLIAATLFAREIERLSGKNRPHPLVASIYERKNFILVRIWRVKVKQERIDWLEKFAHTVSLPMFKQQKGCLGVLFT